MRRLIQIMVVSTVDEHREEMASQGWTMCDKFTLDNLWIVCGTKKREVVCTSDMNRAEAWRKAAEQARIIGLVQIGRN